MLQLFTSFSGKNLLRSIIMPLLFTGMAGVGNAQILSYTTATDGSLNSVAANATGTAVTRVNGDTTTSSPCGTGLTSKSFSSATTYSPSLTANEVTVTPNTGYTLNVTGFSADLRRSGTGPANVRFAYSTDGGASWTAQSTDQSPDNASCGTTTTGTWTTTVTVAAPNTLKFRAYGFNASSSAGVLQSQNLTISGTVVVGCGVPGSLSATSITSAGATLGWGAVTGASSYNVQYRPTGTTTWTSATATTNSKAVSGLTSSTSYEFQVQTVCSAGSSAYSSSFDFTTLSGGTSGTILSYATATDGSLNSVDPNATGTAVARVNGDAATSSPCATGFTSKSFSSATTYSSTLTANEVTLTPNTGYTLNVTGFSADMRRSGTGPANARFAYSTDGGTTWTAQSTDQSPDNAACGTTTTGTWTTTVTVAAPNTLKFRVYGFNASSTAGVLQLQNVTISGSVTGSGGGGGGTLNPKFTIYFNNPVDTTVSTGVYAKYLYHCLADTLIAYINRAKYTIDIAQYEYNQTSGFSNITTAINSAYSRGVAIRWIYDSTETNTLSSLNASIPTLSSPGAGKISPCNKDYTIMHNKFVLIDAKSTNPNDALVWTGSADWTTTHFNSDFNNVIIIQDSALAHAYTNQFNIMWGSTTNTPNASASLWGPCKPNSGQHIFNINGTTVELYFTPSDSTNAHILSTIQSANTDMYMGMYTFSDQPDASAMITAAHSGVVVDAAIDQFSRNDNFAAYDTLVADLDTNHVKTYVGGYIYHNKYLIVDPSNTCSDPQVLTGSHNWTASADQQNDENTLIIHDATIANIYYQAFKQDFNTLRGTLSHVSVGGGCGTTYHKESNPIQEVAAANNAINASIFPNPSQSDFSIQYNLEATANVTISVTNLVGQTVAVMVNNETQEQGMHNYDFKPVASGLYFVRISTGSNTKVYKIIKL